MQLHDLQRKTANKGSKRIGRGRASGKGKTSGRGTKGQKARAGHRIRPDVREKIKKLPKLRGYAFASISERVHPVNLGVLESVFSAGDTVSPATLRERGVVRGRKGKTLAVKILGTGDITKKLTIKGCTVSASAKEKIEKAGGILSS
ncbi:50S ribosomal protein L15 [Candidatus Adlerbacteria bacterium RIFCSPHIGHO2_02_FULL_54_18]|uniref:Large ribosomal subunit protein uL15 n=2 Tax=Candidatus Adleribacteriota TaxID=1752736 RepID=A0A1F4Y270_9BACT|nr:MAG: 50S ribosomal protein L15 [Candidatus Adlerbacteria bacterium RIFCSPLOWO2_01_FULL_54_21b]OGC87886.1 MAG: 50S ribosomal protein L15 [Candidatus Adlerbacteria bacterium RIFCSPHIGHO2_02_FULL_54_18]